MGCIEELKYEVVLSQASFKECREYVKEHFAERYEVEPGFRIFESYIIGLPPIFVGVEGDMVVFPYTKPCHGTFLLRIESPEEVGRLRSMKQKKR
ncbi:MAG TPA: DUF1894 domain-containing protein [Methanomicrobiales archaeon]|jgi:hypothetical protein|nr:DUF1894 domain-containing protein [Methanomicrobiales archaeon]